MSISVPCYQQGYTAFFDYWIDEGLNFPDWDESCYVEFRDSEDQLKFTATSISTPALIKAVDGNGNKFVYVQGIDLSDFALGNVEAGVYAKVEGVNIEPHPTLIPAAFTVVPAIGQAPLYTTVDRVIDELPGSLPESLSTEKLTRYIYDAARYIDAHLASVYSVPFAGIGDATPTPALIERICRKLAAHDCLSFIGMIGDQSPGLWHYKQAMGLLKTLCGDSGRLPAVQVGELDIQPLYIAEIEPASGEGEPLLK